MSWTRFYLPSILHMVRKSVVLFQLTVMHFISILWELIKLGVRFLKWALCTWWRLSQTASLQWRHNERDGVTNQITRLTIVYSTVYSGADQRKHQSSVSLAFVRGLHRWPVNSPPKWPVTMVTRDMFPFDDVIMAWVRVYAYNVDIMPQTVRITFENKLQE